MRLYSAIVTVFLSVFCQAALAQTRESMDQNAAEDAPGASPAASPLPISCPPKPDDKKSARGIAGEMFADGDKFIEAREYLKALSAFVCSLRMVEHPATLFNISQAAELVAETQTAIELLQAYLEQHPDNSSTEKVREILTSIEQRHKALHPDPEEPTKDTEKTPSDTPDVAPGTDDGTAAETDSAPSSDTPTKQDKAAKLALSGYIATGVGVASLCAAAVLFGLEGHTYSKGRDTRDWNEFQDYQSQLKTYQTSGIVLTAVGTVAAAAGVALIIFSKKERLTQSISLIPTTHSLTLIGKF